MPTITPTTTRINSFQRSILGLEHPNPAGETVDLFSRACVEQYQSCDWGHFGYLFAQVFEPDVLLEVSRLEGVALADVELLSYQPTATIAGLAHRVSDAEDLPAVELVNLAAALISISRFGLAARMLRLAGRRATDPREDFEIAMLDFVIANRLGDTAASRRAFTRMAEAISSGTLPEDRIMDASAQAVVWYLKRKELAEADFQQYLSIGSNLVENSDSLDPASVSSWYRALAMVPAGRGQAATTRQYMDYARQAAEDTYRRRPRAYELHLMKTYHESSLKEHMYLTRDPDKAEESGRALIALDPAWSPSHGELADAYALFGSLDKAVREYEAAIAIGPPYVGHHLLKAAKYRLILGDDDVALAHHLGVAQLAPDNPNVLRSALELADRLADSSAGELRNQLDRLTGPAPVGTGGAGRDDDH